jgi:hypothetical protein
LINQVSDVASDINSNFGITIRHDKPELTNNLQR